MESQLSLFSEEIYEYFFLIQPDYKTDKEVKLRKSIASSSIDLSKENLWSVPHLSLLKYRSGYSIDDFIIHKTAKALKDVTEFKVKLDGVDVYNHSNAGRSIVLKVKNPEPIQSINKSLINEFKTRNKKISPHITIVRSISVRDFDTLSGTLSQLDYKGEFQCNKITILKKMIGEDKKYVLLHEAVLN